LTFGGDLAILKASEIAVLAANKQSCLHQIRPALRRWLFFICHRPLPCHEKGRRSLHPAAPM